jgi:murein DD-endopeptidase MepM/ murein hydrolase activator NlpD
MDIILVRKGARPRQVNLGHPLALGAAVIGLGAVLVSAFALGFVAAERFGSGRPDEQFAELRSQLMQQRADLDGVQRQARDDLNALAVRLGQLDAQVIRLDALGDRLTRMAGLTKGEFDFGAPVAAGGPEVLAGDGSVPPLDFVRSVDVLAEQLSDREKQLAVLENILMSKNLLQQVRPSGRPVREGYLSSYFGIRSDPFTGHRAAHYGVDYAGDVGDDIVATASGVVTFSGPRLGYGLLVEVNHGDGIVTRYAHLSESLVAPGDVVKKAQVIARMGSSGRSTGPHVHFEVLREGKLVNPLTYIQGEG